MKVAGIIVEYNPLHCGHTHLLEEIRRKLGEDTAILCVMSGDFVQRGDFAIIRRQARAEAAVRSGADLVLELPLSWAVSGAERFADGGVETLLASGIVTHLAFGSECGDGEALLRIARTLLLPETDTLIRQELRQGDSYAAARQRAVSRLLGREDAALLGVGRANNILGVEYAKALLRRRGDLQVLTVPRCGAAHDSGFAGAEGFPSSSSLRALLRSGEREAALGRMAPAMAALYRTEEAAGRVPALGENCQRAILARLRTMEAEDFAALDPGREGLYRRLYQARNAASLEELLSAAKTRRYAYARLRRMVLWAYLGLTAEDLTGDIPYLRVLAANDKGRALLRQMRQRASLPVVTKPAAVRKLSPEAQKVFRLEARAASLYALACPDLSASRGSLWEESPVIV